MQEITARKLPISIIGKAIAYPFTHMWTLLKIALGPWLISYAFLYGLAFYFTAGNIADFSPFVVMNSFEGNTASLILQPLIDVFVIAIVAVGIHRAIIINENPSWTLVRLRRNEITYIAVAFIINWIVALPLFIFSFAMFYITLTPYQSINFNETTNSYSDGGYNIISYETIILVTFIVIMFSLVCFSFILSMAFPHAAVTGKISFRYAWSITRKHMTKFLLLGALFGCTLLVLGFPLYSLGNQEYFYYFISETSYSHITKTFEYLLPASELMIFSMLVAFFSYCYANLTDEKVTEPQTSSSA